MHIKSLTISSRGRIIRHIDFHVGLNLIVDNTPTDKSKETGNNVGKTTVLKLIDFCLGGNGDKIFSDPENPREKYKLVRDYLINNEVQIALVLKDNLLEEASREVCLERNFLSRKDKILRINGENRTEDQFKEILTEILFPGQFGKKPTYRQIISHNIRYSDQSIENTLRTLGDYASDTDYEALHLFLLGCNYEDGQTKSELETQVSIETNFKKRLEKDHTKSAYESALALVDSEINRLNERKKQWNINENYEKELYEINEVKFTIQQTSSKINQLNLRKRLILEAERELISDISNIDVEQLRSIYSQAKKSIEGIEKTFNDLLVFHNRMLDRKIEYIKKDIPRIELKVQSLQETLSALREKESLLVSSLRHSDSFEDFEIITRELNEKYLRKGELENIIQQIDEVDEQIIKHRKKLISIEEKLYSQSFEEKVNKQKEKFNEYFSSISRKLYGEEYALKVDLVEKKNKQKVYKFSSFNTNFSTGKKQGEVTCFDIAYILFADNEGIPCLHFLLNDKKELMHGNQLVQISNLVEEKNIQFVAAILKDKLPEKLKNKKYFIVELSQNDKLFRIENH